MKDKLKIFIPIMLVMLFCYKPISFAQVYTLEQAIDKALDNSPMLRNLDSQIPMLNEQVRRAKAGANQVDELYKYYKRYKAMYGDSDKPYEDIKKMSSKELSDAKIKLSERIQRLMMRGKFKRADDLSYRLKFIMYADIFGTDEPKLTNQEIYRKFAKTIEMTTIMTDKERSKVLNQKEVIRSTVSIQITKLYLNIINLEKMINLQKDMLALRNEISVKIDSLFDEGLISTNDVWLNEREVEILKEKIDIYRMQLNILKYNFNNLMGEDIEKINRFVSVSVNTNELFKNSIKDYVLTAQKNNTLLKSYNLDLEYAKKDLELYKKYDGKEVGELYEDMVFEINSLEKNINRQNSEVEKNVKFEYENLILLKGKSELAKKELEVAIEKFKQDKLRLDLGMIKVTDMHKSEINKLSKYIDYKLSEQNLKQGQIMFDCLVKYGQI